MSYMHRVFGLVLLAATLQPFAAAQQPPAGTLPTPQTQLQSFDVSEQLRLGKEAYQRRDYAGAFRIYSDVIAHVPDSSVALNMAGNCSLELENYPAAIDFFQRGLNVHPDNPFDIGGLLTVYSLTGKTIEAGEQRAHLQQLKASNKVPDNFRFVVDKFQVGDRTVKVVEFFPYSTDKFHYHYWFVVEKDGQPVYRVALESDDADQKIFPDLDPKEAAARRRRKAQIFPRRIWSEQPRHVQTL
jgi:tetratricopeptide (TPR) repeat protein